MKFQLTAIAVLISVATCSPTSIAEPTMEDQALTKQLIGDFCDALSSSKIQWIGEDFKGIYTSSYNFLKINYKSAKYFCAKAKKSTAFSTKEIEDATHVRHQQ